MPMFKAKRVQTIEAVQWLNKKIACPPGPMWFVEAEENGIINLHGDILSIRTFEGDRDVMIGDWVCRFVPTGQIFPCSKDKFEKYWEPV